MKKYMGKTLVTILIMGCLLFAGRKGLAGLETANEERYLQKIFPYLLPGSTTFTLEMSVEAEEESQADNGAEEAGGPQADNGAEPAAASSAGEGGETEPVGEEIIPEESEEAAEEEEIIRFVYRGETGYVICAVTQGYVDEIELLVGVDDSGKVKGLCVYGQHETLGLGAASQTNVPFLQQYLGTSGEAQTGTTVDALTGATVSSKAVTKGVNAAVAYVTGADISSGATSWGG